MQETFIHTVTQEQRQEIFNKHQMVLTEMILLMVGSLHNHSCLYDGGEALTKVDAFFSQKDAELPVTCQIREMQNGYPTTTVLPFASVTLEAQMRPASQDVLLQQHLSLNILSM